MAENRTKRLETLLNKIRMDETTTVEEMSRFFSVSPSTIRRDIKVLEEGRYVIRTVGGGIVYKKDLRNSHGQPTSIPFIDEKIRITEYCTEIVRDDDEIIVGPGTTTLLAGKILSGITNQKFRIITNSLELALETTGAPNIRTVTWVVKSTTGIPSGSRRTWITSIPVTNGTSCCFRRMGSILPTASLFRTAGL